ncbi:hypothetical protein LTR84_003542 [Exophiala bonariae]|uniref:Major facilitator superfamily (MFS) profile domain-containing protein n=1 Tax=Exophiala bonariae TaxID=1690606 RepID=A0AAV9N8H2_9EURO|nr:hypothetical protein LTR84_003542 [Exophiala bonariae]
MEQNGEFVAGTLRLVNEPGETDRPSRVVLVPAPTKNINDPLNWSRGAKLWVASNLLAWTFFANAAIAWTSPAWAVWTIELNTTFTLLNYGQALLVLMCGFGCLFLQPWALKYGRRSVYVLGSILILIGLALGATMKNINGFYAYMILSGFGSAPSYATIITSLIDITFLHQKGRVLSLYGIVLILGNFLPPVAAGYITQSQGWKWCFYYLIIFFVVSSLLVLSCAEETLFPRTSIVANVEHGIDRIDTEVRDESSEIASKQPVDGTYEASLSTPLPTSVGEPQENVTSVPTQRYTYAQRMTLFRPNTNVKASYIKLTFEVFQVCTLPAAVWASWMIAIATFVVGYVFTTQASFFAAPPYNFDASQLGLMYFALIIGNFIGAIYGGNVADWIVLRLAKANNGIAEAEHRLWAYIPVPFLGAIGVLLYGVGASHGIHWIVPCLGLVFVGIFLNASLPVAMGYALDSYVDLSGEIVQLSNFIRNLVGGAFTFGIQPWITYNGAQTTSIIIAVVIFVLNLSSIPFQIWGKSIRRRTAKRYLKLTNRATYY